MLNNSSSKTKSGAVCMASRLYQGHFNTSVEMSLAIHGMGQMLGLKLRREAIDELGWRYSSGPWRSPTRKRAHLLVWSRNTESRHAVLLYQYTQAVIIICRLY